ncbi:ferrochelatase [Propionicicella superfundia]|uniref:ferrochelatase n=1 Tax=Propionicicella superfundia TaxID=348582 RepID=UPI00040D934D|nr:ferrochelatase [Propionicicella superfundia]
MPVTADSVLLVVNLGTPEAPAAPEVRRYLAEFLGDRRVVNLPAVLWKPILHGFVLPFRGPKSAALYQKVWLDEGSPLLVHTTALAERIAARMPDWTVIPAMTYGRPALRDILRDLREDPPQRVVVLPLYPQYSTTTTAPIFDQLDAHGAGLPLTRIDDYSDDEAWLSAVVESIRRARSQDDEHRHLLFSFHGLPQKVADAGDPYPVRCESSARTIAAGLGLADDQWSMSYQSKFGPAQWLLPATTDEVDRLAAEGVTDIDVVCPGFAVDCLETLEEIAIRLGEQYAEHGGRLRYIPCLNASDAHADALTGVALRVAADGDLRPA